MWSKLKAYLSACEGYLLFDIACIVVSVSQSDDNLGGKIENLNHTDYREAGKKAHSPSNGW